MNPTGPTTATQLIMQGNGDLVLYDASLTAITTCTVFCHLGQFAPGTPLQQGAILDLSTGGSLVVYTAVGGTPLVVIH